MTDLVTFELTDGVADIRFNRPDKHNSLTLEMFAAIVEAGEQLRRTPGARVAVLSGNGPSFCAGLDFSLMRRMLAGPAEAQTVLRALMHRDERPDNLAQRSAYTWKTAPVPVIGALRGVAFGGGCQIALGCDIRIAAPDLRMSVMEVRYGLVPDMALTQTLPDLVPQDVAMELALTGRIVEAEEAHALGLVTRVEEDPRAAAFALAHSIAARSPDAVRAAKRLLHAAWRADPRTGLAMEEGIQLTLLGTPNQLEAVNSGLENRRGRFVDS